MSLIDSHAHLTDASLLPQIDGVLARAGEAGVEKIITVGTSLADAQRAVDLAWHHAPRVYAAVAFHPHEAARVTEESLSAMARLWRQDRVVAIGEMGLDYHYDFADRTTQREVFSRQLMQAKPLDKPIVVHCREAFDETVAILETQGYLGRRVVFHCFTGTVEEATLLRERGWRVSFTGIVTFPKAEGLQEVAASYPPEELMIETDSPYLSPVPLRGKHPNEPSRMVHLARFLATLRNVDYEDFSIGVTRNTREFFNLSD